MNKKEFEMGAECLGHPGVVANWWRTAAGTDPRCRRRPQVTIFEAAVADEHVYCPAVSITIQGKEALLALRAVIDEALCNEPDEEK